MSYTKRPLTDDIALIVATKDAAIVKFGNETFKELTKLYKYGELAAQQDACPVKEAPGLLERVGYLKQKIEGFRIRHAQLGGIAAIDGIVDGIDEATAEYLFDSGSIAVIAQGYGNNADKILLSKGIIPLISDESIPEGEFILIRNIRQSINGGELNAIKVYPDRDEKVSIRIDNYTEAELAKVIN